jgi:drug/metabolite transporter (DMT)-like permease
MIFDLKTKKNLPFMTSVAQCNHMVFIFAIISFFIWGFTNEFMKGTSEDDKNMRLWFYVAAILFIGIACSLKLSIIQITQQS